MKSKIAFAVVLVLCVVGGLAATKALQIQKLMAAAKSFAEPPEAVSTAVASDEKWQVSLTAVGSVSAVQGVLVTSEIPGMVRDIAFESGATVAKGDLLIRLDTSSEEAQLRSVEAQVELARLNALRARTLRADKTVSEADLDTAEATLKQYQASADAIRATIEKKTIRAPFGGRLGIRLVNLGQYLDAGKPIVSLQALTPAFADFALPQQELARLKIGMRVRVSTDAYPDHVFEGKLTAMNPDLDQSMRSVSLQATFENADQLLRPGMFVRTEVLFPEEQTVLVIPATAVLNAPYGDSVFVVESKTGQAGKSALIVRQQFVRTGHARGDFVTVESGLKAGERVVTAGLFKLRNGMAIVENNTLVPKPETAPHPAEG
jgi:membrane fusion protein (multidrug efflux system)